MEVETIAFSAVHFGAGSLGLGLVIPCLHDAGWKVTVVDADVRLVNALTEKLGYEVQVHHAGQVEKKPYPVYAALSPVSQLEAVLAAVRSSTLITTSVRYDNLPKVANVLRRAFGDKPHASHNAYIIACENVRSASTKLATLMQTSQPASLSETHFLNAEVDRICQTEWPDKLSVKTEHYYEWLVETPATDELSLKTASFVADINSYFDRKRYLVNTVADAIAFLGVAYGHKYLHQAASDSKIVEELEPAARDLVRYLELEYAFSPQALRAYYATNLQRFQNEGIARALDTVARDPERKLGAQERFVAPALALCKRGLEPLGLAHLTRTIIDMYPQFSSKTWSATWGNNESAQHFASLVEQSQSRTT